MLYIFTRLNFELGKLAKLNFYQAKDLLKFQESILPFFFACLPACLKLSLNGHKNYIFRNIYQTITWKIF
jgi:hypothetical protein